MEHYSQVFAVGDIHGCKNLLDNIHNQIIKISQKKDGKKLIVYLGDYIDRGPDVKGTIQALIDFQPKNFTKVFLLGNHEQMLLEFIAESTNSPYVWISNGGLETFTSYGQELANYIDDSMHLNFNKKIKNKFIEYMPKSHMKFFNSLKLNYIWKDYLFVHAGINPDFPLDKQEKETMIWTREKHFFKPTMTFSKIVVHGHTPNEKVENFPYRINLDTGSFYSGKLSCLIIQDEKIEFIDSLNISN